MKNPTLYFSLFATILALLLVHRFSHSRAEGIPILPSEVTREENGIMTPAGNDFWTWRGPQHDVLNLKGPQVNHLSVHPTNPNIIYAGTNQGFYRSNDAGESWVDQNEGLGGYGDLVITAIATDHTNPNRLLIATWGAGIWQSTNGGVSWVRLQDPLTSANTQLQATQNRLLPAEVTGLGPSYTYQGEAMFPVSQYPEGLPIKGYRTATNCIVMNPANPGELFACVDDGHGLYQSTSGGNSWQKIDLGVGSSRAFTFAPSNNQIRYASFGSWSVSGGLFRTTNGGAVWTQVAAGTILGTVTSIAIHPNDTTIVLAATTNDGLYRSSDGGSSWVKVSNALPDTTFYTVKFSPNNPDIVYAGGFQHVYRSNDSGISWVVADASLSANAFAALALHPTQADTVWLGSNSDSWGGVYKRPDVTQPFTFRSAGMEDLFILDIEVAPYNPAIIFAATWGAGGFRSNNGGQNWVKIPQLPPYIYDIDAVRNGASTVLYATTFYTDYGIFKSLDLGATWFQVSNVYPSNVSFDIESIYNNPDKLVAATFSGVQYSNDGGANWFAADILNNHTGIVLRICEFPGTGRLLAATYGGGVYYSVGGTFWYEANTGLLTETYSGYTYDIACSPDTPGLAYVAGRTVSKTANYGESWQPMNTGLPRDYFRAIDIVPGIGDVFVATLGNGVYVAPKASPIWTEINTGLLEKNTRAIRVVNTSPVRVMVGTNGLGIWDYTLISRPKAASLYLPAIVKGVQPLSCQSYESNDSFALATPLPGAGRYCSYSENEEDVDYYRFTITSLTSVIIDLRNITNSEAEYRLTLYDTNQSPLAIVNVLPNGDDRITFQPMRTGQYYLAVYPTSWNEMGDPQQYYLDFSYGDVITGGNAHGIVQQGGVPIANLPVRIEYANGYRIRTITTQTDSSGAYRFQELDSLPFGHFYRVSYWNLSEDVQRLFNWYCEYTINFPDNAQPAPCSFDVSNVFLISPTHNVTVTLPVTFSWAVRNLPDDDYELRLYSSTGTPYWTSGRLGQTVEYELTSLPPGFVAGEPYYWGVVVHNSVGQGHSYYVHWITFSSPWP